VRLKVRALPSHRVAHALPARGNRASAGRVVLPQRPGLVGASSADVRGFDSDRTAPRIHVARGCAVRRRAASWGGPGWKMTWAGPTPGTSNGGWSGAGRRGEVVRQWCMPRQKPALANRLACSLQMHTFKTLWRPSNRGWPCYPSNLYSNPTERRIALHGRGQSC